MAQTTENAFETHATDILLNEGGRQAGTNAEWNKDLAIKGTLHILRHGFKFYGKMFRLAYFKAANSLNYDLDKLYRENQLTVTRQVACHSGRTRRSVCVERLTPCNG